MTRLQETEQEIAELVSHYKSRVNRAVAVYIDTDPRWRRYLDHEMGFSEGTVGRYYRRDLARMLYFNRIRRAA